MCDIYYMYNAYVGTDNALFLYWREKIHLIEIPTT
jgi:hypothetical protein